MYQPGVPCGAHEVRLAGFACEMILVPGGAIGVLLKSKLPWSWLQAERFGLMREVRSKLSVMTAWGRSLSQRYSGKFLSVLQRPAMKWFLKVRMARSAAFRR